MLVFECELACLPNWELPTRHLFSHRRNIYPVHRPRASEKRQGPLANGGHPISALANRK